jgi:hypothetical protein
VFRGSTRTFCGGKNGPGTQHRQPDDGFSAGPMGALCQKLGINEVDEGIWLVSFMHYGSWILASNDGYGTTKTGTLPFTRTSEV